MKRFSIAFIFLAFLSMGFFACENHMDIRDIEAGTPTNADSVLAPSKHHGFSPEEVKKYDEQLPQVYRR